MPRGDQEKLAWLNNFDTEIASISVDLGILPAEIAAIHSERLVFNYVMDKLQTLKAETQEYTKYKDLLIYGGVNVSLGDIPSHNTLPLIPTTVPAGVFNRIAKIVKRIKNHPNYNQAIGKSLRIIGSEKYIDFSKAKVKIKLRRSGEEGVEIDFVKGESDGVIVYAGNYETSEVFTINNEPIMIWTEINRTAFSPFIDKRLNQTNKPETRHYKMRYIKKMKPIGMDSDILAVIANVIKA